MSKVDDFKLLIADRARTAQRRHGALEVAMAVAAAAKRVRVEAQKEPFVTSPPDLFERPFEDPLVGLDQPGMAAFKGNLISLLPSIAADVRRIPDSPALRVDDVARYVALSLAAVRRRAPQPRRPRVGGLVLTGSGVLHQARERVRTSLGATFAAKASDAVLLSLGGEASVARESAVTRRRSPAASFAPGSLILELNSGVDAQAPARADTGRESTLREAARLVDRETRDRHVGTSQMLRQTQLAPLRDAFYKVVAPICADIGRRAAAPSSRESVATMQPLDVCWLNETIRTAIPATAVSEVAHDSMVERIGMPRRLVREMRQCGPLVGAPVFRTKTGNDGTGIVVAVIDGEVDVSHPALKGRVMQKRNFSREPFGFPDEHGTGVAGIIGAGDSRFSGIAPGVSILNYKVFATQPRFDSDDFDAAVAIQQALEDGAHIVNCSWGAGAAGDGTSRQAKACDRAWSLGLVIVKSAGNRGPGGRSLTSPADADGVIVVGATDRRGQNVQSYSSRGPAGSRQRPHLVAPGGSDSSGVETCTPGGGFGSMSPGTSFAAPHVSGLAALLLDRDANLSPDTVRDMLIRSCTPLPGADVNMQGAGLVHLAV
jgi:serine protease AprX